MEDCENFTTDATSFKREINSFAPHGFTILDISKAKLVSYFIIKTLLVSFLLYYPEICKKIAALRLGLMNKRTEIVSGWFWLISGDFNGTLLDKELAFSWIHLIQKLMKKGKKQLSRHTLPDFTLHSSYIFNTYIRNVRHWNRP